MDDKTFDKFACVPLVNIGVGLFQYLTCHLCLLVVTVFIPNSQNVSNFPQIPGPQ